MGPASSEEKLFLKVHDAGPSATCHTQEMAGHLGRGGLLARHCRRDEGLEDSEKRWWCMMEKGVGLHVLVLGMEE